MSRAALLPSLNVHSVFGIRRLRGHPEVRGIVKENFPPHVAQEYPWGMDWTYEVLQNTLSYVVQALLSLGGAVVLGWLKKRGSLWTTPALYGLAGFLLINGCFITLRLLFTPAPKAPEEITIANIETHVRDWADHLRLAVRRGDSADAYLVFVISLSNGHEVAVSRNKTRDRYLTFEGAIQVSPEHRDVISHLPADQAAQLMDEVLLEMARSRLNFSLVGRPLQSVHIVKSVPIGNGLTEDVFAASIDEIDGGMFVARESIRLALSHRGLIRSL